MPEAVATPVGDAPDAPERTGGLARSTLVFAILTGVSRVTALLRDILAARYFGVAGAMSAYTIAFQVPNLVRALVSDSALQGAFVPVFTELLEQGRRRDAFRLAWTIGFLLVLLLGSLSAVIALAAEHVAPLLAPGFGDQESLRDLTANLTRVMFPTVIFFSLSGLVGAMINSFGGFGPPVGAQVLFNLVSVVGLVVLVPPLSGDAEIYAFAGATLAASAVQFVFPLPWLRGHDGRRLVAFDPRQPEVMRVLKLMLPVTLALGLFQFSLLLNSLLGTLVSQDAPAAIDRAFRIVVLPQAVFSLAITTVLFPTLSRLAARGDRDELRRVVAQGVRVMSLFMIPSALALVVLAEPATRLVYERGAFDADATDLVAGALAVWACSLPVQAAGTFMAQTFFSLQRAWVTVRLSAVFVAVNAGVGYALHGPFGVDGIVAATVLANVVVVATYTVVLRRALRGLDARANARPFAAMLGAGAAFALAVHLSWNALDGLLPETLPGQFGALAGALAAGSAVYCALLLLFRVPDAVLIGTRIAKTLRRDG